MGVVTISELLLEYGRVASIHEEPPLAENLQPHSLASVQRTGVWRVYAITCTQLIE